VSEALWAGFRGQGSGYRVQGARESSVSGFIMQRTPTKLRFVSGFGIRGSGFRGSVLRSRSRMLGRTLAGLKCAGGLGFRISVRLEKRCG
jgi:hypothetical protein